MTPLPVAAGLAYRESGSEGAAHVALMVHGFPESSYRWRPVLDALPPIGWRGLAPDLPGFGDSEPDPPSTWERHVEALERFRAELGLERVVLCVDDWGGLIGLRWACDHPEAVAGLVISSTGFFPDGKWHGMARILRSEGEGERFMEALTPALLAASLRQISPAMTDDAIAEYWKCLADRVRRRGALELYRSGDFEKLDPYCGKLAALAVPALVLWGEDDPFAPVAGAQRLGRELPGAKLVVLEGVGHFTTDDAPDRVAAEVTGFLQAAYA